MDVLAKNNVATTSYSILQKHEIGVGSNETYYLSTTFFNNLGTQTLCALKGPLLISTFF